MPRATSEKVGQGACPSAGCGAPVWFRKTTTGLLWYRCEACDSNGYAEPGGKAYKARIASMQPVEPVEAKPDPAPAPARKPRAAPAPGSSVFNLAHL